MPLADVKVEAIPAALNTRQNAGADGAGIGSATTNPCRPAGLVFKRRFMGVGMLEPLDSFVEGEGFDLEQYYPNCIAEARYEGNLMALPHISE